jgi:hypothetical protein
VGYLVNEGDLLLLTGIILSPNNFFNQIIFAFPRPKLKSPIEAFCLAPEVVQGCAASPRADLILPFEKEEIL